MLTVFQERGTTAAHTPVPPTSSFNPDADLAYSLEAQNVASNSWDITLSHDVALAQYLETRGEVGDIADVQVE